MRHASLIAALLLCAAWPARGAPLSADTQQTLPSGPTFSAAKQWNVTPGTHRIVLTAPEGNLHVAIVDAGAARDAAEAVSAAWQTYRPGDMHKLKVTAPAAARQGWDQASLFEYETSPNEHLVMQAMAFRKGAAWTVMIVDGSDATAEKRGAAIGLALGSLRPAGYHRENFLGMTPHPLDAARIKVLRDFVADGMRKLRVPGAGLALIDHGRVVYAGGLGVKELGKPDPVDADTLFMIASNTKGLTTLMLAKLADEGKLQWDQPVTQVYKPFRLGSANTTRQVLMRHLICACTGVPRRDYEVLFNSRRDTPVSDTFKQLADTEPTSKFSEVFQYSNLMAGAAGYIGGHLAHPDMDLGAAYDATMQEDVFGPLGMTSTTFDYARALAGDHAMPHGDTIDGKQVAASMDLNYTFIPIRPAGSAWSSVHDMARYVQEELTPGRTPEGAQIVSAKNVLARRVSNVSLGEDANYGMGLITSHKYGVLVVQHGGDLIGFHSNWFAVTDAQVGAVILTNGDNGHELTAPLLRRLLEVLYDGKREAQKALDAAAAQVDAEISKERPYLTVPADASKVAALAPHYVNPSLGSITVRHDRAALIFDFGAWRSEMASRKNDDGTTSFVTISPGVSGFAFVVTGAGLTVHDGQHNYVYAREA